MNDRTFTPSRTGLFAMVLLPVAAYGYPEIFDWRFGALVMAACAAGAWAGRLLPRSKHAPRPAWGAVYGAYAIALIAPRVAFEFIGGRYALPASWTPLWPGGRVVLGHWLDAVTDGLLLAAVPAGIVALLTPHVRRKKWAAPPKCPRAEGVRLPGRFVRVLSFAGPPAVFAAAAWGLALRIPQGHLLCARIDVMLNVWNQWWFKKALLDPQLSILHSDYIFQPFGVSLLWHTLGPLNCLIGTAYQALTGAEAIGTYNFTAMASFALMGWAGYLLGRRVGCASVGFFAGFAIMLCGAHLGQVRAGHLGLANAQWVLFFLLFVLRLCEGGRTADALLAGVFWAAAFYTHFYHAIFCAIIYGIVVLALVGKSAANSGAVRGLAGRLRRVLGHRCVLPVVVVLAALAFWSPQRWRWLMLGAWVVVVLAAGGKIGRTFAPQKWWRAALPALVAGAATAPWLVPMFARNIRSQGSLDWGRPSAVYAMDVLGYVIPSENSRGGSLFEPLWRRFTVPGGDSSAFLGLPVIALAVYGLLRHRKPFWVFIAAAFGLLSFGPVLHVLGMAVTRWRMPYVAIEAVPFLSAGGVAGRYAMPASAGVVMIASAGLAGLMARFPKRRAIIGAGAVLSVMISGYPPLFYYQPPQPKLLQLIREDSAEGNVLPQCPIDTALWFQTIHGKKMIRGFASRVPRRVLDFAHTSPVFHEIRYGKPLRTSREAALETLHSYKVRWIIVAEGLPRSTIEEGLGLRPVAVEGDVYLYRLELSRPGKQH